MAFSWWHGRGTHRHTLALHDGFGVARAHERGRGGRRGDHRAYSSRQPFFVCLSVVPHNRFEIRNLSYQEPPNSKDS